MSDSFPEPSGSGSADTLTLDEVDGLGNESASPGALKAWLLDETRAGRLSVSQREVPLVNPAMVRTFKLRGNSGAGRAHDTDDLFGRPISAVRPKPAPLAPAVVLTTEYRVTKQAIGNLAPALLAKGWWQEGLQRWTGVDPRPQPATVYPSEGLPSADIEKRLTVYSKAGKVLAWKSVWGRISSEHPTAKVRHGHYELSRVETAISAMGYTCKTGGLAQGMPRTTGASSVFDIANKTAANNR